MENIEIKFPRDENNHENITEWWYFNGNLKGENGKDYSFMSSLFQVYFPAATDPAFAGLPQTKQYFYHGILTDVTDQKFEPKIDYFLKVSDESFLGKLLSVDFAEPIKSFKDGYYIHETKQFEYEIKGDNFELSVKSKKKPLLVGGNGFVDNVGAQTFYYSLTHLETSGYVCVGGKKVKVSGKSWMDHQWGDFGIPKGFWNWFSIQLDNNVELVCYESGKGETSTRLATMIDADGKQKSFTDIQIVEKEERWTSPLTGASYPLDWQINIPGMNAEITIETAVRDHEVRYGYVNYWEGPTIISGRIDGKKITGRGYLELVGRPNLISRLLSQKEASKN